MNLHQSLFNEVVSEVSIRQELQHNHDLQCVYCSKNMAAIVKMVVGKQLLHPVPKDYDQNLFTAKNETEQFRYVQ